MMGNLSRYLLLATAFCLTFTLIACGGVEDDILCSDIKDKIHSCVPDSVLDDSAQCSPELLTHYEGFMDLGCDQLATIGKADWWWILAAAAGAVIIGSMIANNNKSGNNSGNNSNSNNSNNSYNNSGNQTPQQPGQQPPPPCSGPQCNQPPSLPNGQCYSTTQCGTEQCVALEGQCKSSNTVPYNGVCSNFEGWHQPHLCQQGLTCTMTSQLYVAPNGNTVNIFRCLP